MDYASVVVLQINPEFKIYLDATQHILKVEPQNKDAEDVMNDLSVDGLSMTEDLGNILEETVSKGYLVDGKNISLTISEVLDSHVQFASQILEGTESICKDILAMHNIQADVSLSEENYAVVSPVQEDKGKPTKSEQEEEVCPTCGGTGREICPTCRQ